MKGWVSIYRNIMEHWIWTKPEYLKGWMYILLMANHKEKKVLHNFETVLIKRGEHITTLRMMGIQIGLSKNRVKTFLRILEENNMIVLKRDTKATHILVIDYVKYQNNETEVRQPQDSHKTKQ